MISVIMAGGEIGFAGLRRDRSQRPLTGGAAVGVEARIRLSLQFRVTDDLKVVRHVEFL